MLAVLSAGFRPLTGISFFSRNYKKEFMVATESEVSVPLRGLVSFPLHFSAPANTRLAGSFSAVIVSAIKKTTSTT